VSNSRAARRHLGRTRPTGAGLAAARHARAIAESATAVLDRPTTEQVSNRPWSDFSQADYSLEQWHRACLIHRHTGAPTAKTQCSLPVREPSGRLNRNGVHAAAARIGQVEDAPAEQIRRAARTLVRLYRTELDEEPPESLLSRAGEASRSAEAVSEIGVVEAPRPGRPGRMLIQLIKAGWSRNGRYYPAEVLRRDGPQAFPAGTLAFVDHATEEEDTQRPAGSVRNLAGVLEGPARWDPERNALIGELRLFQPWREQLTDMAEHIGMSIRAWVMGDHGTAEGRDGFVISEITEGRSVDFVTVPAAGGAILSVLESAQPRPAEQARNVGAWLESRLHRALAELSEESNDRLTQDEHAALSAATGEALQAWAARVERDAPQLYTREPQPASEETSQPEPEPEPEAETPVAVKADETPTSPVVSPLPVAETVADLARLDKLLGHTPDVPAPAPVPATHADGSPPAAQPIPSTDKEAAPMSETTNDGARAPDPAGAVNESRQVEATEAQVAVIAQERDAYKSRAHSLAEALTEAQNAQRRAEAERDAAVAEARRLRANEAARLTVDRMIAAPESGVPERHQAPIAERVHAAVHDRVPLTAAGEVDQQALEGLVASAIRNERVYLAQRLEAEGHGKVQGLGAEGDPTMQMTAEQFAKQVSSLYADLGLDETTVDLATKGR